MTIPFNEYGIHIATEDDYPQVIEILAQSFQQDPQLQWMLNGANNIDQLEKIMGYMIDMAGENTIITITNENNGVAIWESSKETEFSLSMIPPLFSTLFSVGIEGVVRSFEDKELSAQHRPDSDHYYLAMLAVHPNAQGMGIANRLLYPVLNFCKNECIPVHLETGNPRNVEIYKKKGFVLNDTVENDKLSRFYMSTEV